MKLDFICKCGFLFRTSQIDSVCIRLQKDLSLYEINLQDAGWHKINYCPMCSGHKWSELYDTTNSFILEVCCCGIKETIDAGDLSDSIFSVANERYGLKLGETDFIIGDGSVDTFERTFWINFCFNCGKSLTDATKTPSSLSGSQQASSLKLLEDELNQIYEQLPLINSKSDAIRLFGNPDEILSQEKFGVQNISARSVYSDFRFIEEPFCYSKYKTIRLRIDFYFNSSIGYALVPDHTP